jgi:hypothetical protein
MRRLKFSQSLGLLSTRSSSTLMNTPPAASITFSAS